MKPTDGNICIFLYIFMPSCIITQFLFYFILRSAEVNCSYSTVTVLCTWWIVAYCTSDGYRTVDILYMWWIQDSWHIVHVVDSGILYMWWIQDSWHIVHVMDTGQLTYCTCDGYRTVDILYMWWIQDSWHIVHVMDTGQLTYCACDGYRTVDILCMWWIVTYCVHNVAVNDHFRWPLKTLCSVRHIVF